MEKKHKLRLLVHESSHKDAINKMIDGNLGALSVCCKLCEDIDGFVYLGLLDGLGFYGPDIWAAYKDYAGQDIEKLKEALKCQDKEMIHIVERERLPYKGDGQGGQL